MRHWLTIDNLLILAVFAVTVPRAGYAISRDDDPSLWFIGYMAAVVLDLATWRFAYVFQVSRGKNKKRLYLVAFLTFAAFALFWQTIYLMERLSLWESVIKSAVWPLSVIFLAVHHGMSDMSDERREMTKEPVCNVTPPVVLDNPRDKALSLYGQGWSFDKIAETLGKSERQVRRYVKKNDIH